MTSENTMKKTSLTTIRDAQEILHHHLQCLWTNPERAADIPPLMLWGPPGIGKSTVIRELTEEMDIGFIDVRLAQREPVDIRGLPVPREDRQGVDWIVSSEWPREGQENFKSRGIILFDEITAADPSLQVAAYEFILDRRLGLLYDVPEGWYIVAAGNRTKDGAVARSMSSALANRFCHLELRSDANSWIEWGWQAGIHPSVLAFIRFRPDLLFNMNGDRERGWPSPRTWARVSLEMQMAEQTGLSNRALSHIIEGLIGIGTSIEFLGFLKWAEKLPDVGKVLRGEAEVYIPERSDQKFALISAMVHHVLEESDISRIVNGVIDIMLAFSNDWCQMAYHDIELTLTGRDRLDDLIILTTHPRHEELEIKILGAIPDSEV
tara:strand:+ start:265 stop:1401 length:1137 start_codon:yes stop_codon:yes gene_type:complete